MKLEIGYKTSFDIRTYALANKKLAGLRIVYLSDFHFNKKSETTRQAIVRAINIQSPDLILLGGDYVDTTKGYKYFEQLLIALKRYDVYAIAGNHDYFKSEQRIKKIVTDAGAHWLEGKSLLWKKKGFAIQLDGGGVHARNAQATFQILILHRPLPLHKVSTYDLVFAGHLHGCQFVFWKKKEALYPGKFFYPLNSLSFITENCHYFISKGLGDTLPIRYNCKRDFVSVSFK